MSSLVRKIFGSNKRKVFCIGFGKTGTTSVEKALKDLGYEMGDQAHGEMLIKAWSKRDFDPIIEFCKTAQAFQDIPFCLPFTYIALDQAFPGSRFILTIRDNADQWYESLTKFHAKIHGNGKLPDAKDLKASIYRYKGFAWDVRKAVWNVNEEDVYSKSILTNSYNRHNEDVIEYFRHRPDDLLVINVSKKNAYKDLCKFLNKQPMYETFPWENKTDDIKTN